MQMPHAFSERKSSTSIRGGLKLEKDSGRKSNLVYGKLNWWGWNTKSSAQICRKKFVEQD